MLVNLARGVSGLGPRVQFIVGDRERPFLEDLPQDVDLIEFAPARTRQCLTDLVQHLRTERPAAVLSAKTSDDMVALRAKRLAGTRTKFILRPGTTFSQRLAGKRNLLKRWLVYRKLRPLFRQADGVVAVSRGVANDIAGSTGSARERIHVIANPTVTPELETLAQAPLVHPWFDPVTDPIILGIGGLRRSKDFPTLVRAFALVRREQAVRLVILGRGGRREALLKLARELRVDEDVELPGFVSNPYAYLSRASVFVLSSLWEGSPNVLIEALAVGTPVVATDCPSGPGEILQGGRYGALVPPGDVVALAGAIIRTLRAPLPPLALREAVGEHVMEHAAKRYLEVFGIRPP